MRSLLRTVSASSPLRPSPAKRSSSTASNASPARFKGQQQPATVQQPALEDVVRSWNVIKSILDGSFARSGRGKGRSASDEQTLLLRRQLDSLVESLVAEASLLSFSDGTGECMEWILTNDILETLVRLAAPDQPNGALAEILRTFNDLVTLLGESLIAYAHRPIVNLIAVCSPRKASLLDEDGVYRTHEEASRADDTYGSNSRYDAELTGLICSVCARLKAHTELLPIFFNDRAKLYKARLDGGTVRPAAPRTTTGSLRTLEIIKSPLPSPDDVGSRDSNLGTRRGVDSHREELATSSNGVPEHAQDDSYNEDFPIFQLLLQFLARDGPTGSFARQGLLSIFELACLAPENLHFGHKVPEQSSSVSEDNTSLRNDDRDGRSSRSGTISSINSYAAGAQARLGIYILRSDFAELLAAGLGASLGLLPRRLYMPRQDFGLAAHPISTEADQLQAEAQQQYLEKLRDESVASSADADLQKNTDLFKDLLSFTQDLCRRVDSPSATDGTSGRQHHSRQLHYFEQKLLRAVSSALLENTLYPSLHEVFHPSAFSADGSSPTSPSSPISRESRDLAILALLWQLNAIFESLQAGSSLSNLITTSLAQPDERVAVCVGRAREDATVASGTPNKEVTNGLIPQPLRMDRLAASSPIDARTKLYTNPETMSRWTQGLAISSDPPGIVDVFSHDASSTAAQSSSQAISLRIVFATILADPSSSRQTVPIRLSTYKLLNILLSKFDAAARQILSARPAAGSTDFPFRTASTQPIVTTTRADEDFEYPARSASPKRGGDGSDTDSFVYPGLGIEGMHAPRKINGSCENPVEAKITSSPSTEASDLELLLMTVKAASLVPKSPSMGDSSAPINGKGSFLSYLEQAEAAIARDPSFKQGMHLLNLSHETSTPEAVSQLTSTLHTLSCSDEGSLIELLVRHLLSFFFNTPAENILLTHSLVALAASPCRSLSGWLLPEKGKPLSLLREGGMITSAYKPRSFNLKPSAKLSRSHGHQALGPTAAAGGRKAIIPLSLGSPGKPRDKVPSSLSPVFAGSSQAASTMGIFSILAQLMDMVETEFLDEVPNLAEQLFERRASLSFAEQLTEALSEPESRNAIGVGSVGNAMSGEEHFSLGSQTSNAASPLRHRAAAAYLTPPRPQARSVHRLKDSNGLSPYAAHYARTEAIRIVPRRATSPFDKKTREIPTTPTMLKTRSSLEAFTSPTLTRSPPASPTRARAPSANGVQLSSPPTSPSFRSAFSQQHRRRPSQNVGSGSSPGNMAGATQTQHQHRRASPSVSSILSARKRERDSETSVPLSSILDNIIILEEAVQELLALVVVRRRLGIDRID